MKRIVSLPLRGIVTTNYDVTVLAAIADNGSSSFRDGTWQDEETLRDWRQESIFGEGIPVLFTHGKFDKPDSIVFTLTEYEKAYGNDPYRTFFSDLSLRYNLLFIGYSFGDFFMQILSRADQRRLGSTVTPDAKHIAFIGVDSKFEYDKSKRTEYLQNYNTEVIFYPSNNHHSKLVEVLELVQELVQVS